MNMDVAELEIYFPTLSKVKGIIIIEDNDSITKPQIFEWFFSGGNIVEDLFDHRDILKLYGDFVFNLLSTKNSIKRAFNKILNRGS